ncbi:MFS transporter [Burkholderia cenocepacia]|nr:MFS transporter [Burkholderia cenocepacia]MBR8266145.1 MFS transporter [Burkholderia cenocepacia]
MPPEIVRPDDHDTRGRGAKVAIAFLIGAGLINNLDRSALSVANHLVASELQLSAAQMGMLMSSFSIVYAFSQLPIGLILDRFGARIVFGLGLLFWSTAQLACGFVQTYKIAHDDQARAARPGFADWRTLMFQRNTIAMMLGSAGVIYMIWLYVSWLPAYLEHEQHVSIAKTGWLAAIPYAAGTLGQLSCGTFIDFLTRKGYSVSLSRKIPTCIGLVVAAISGVLFSIYFANVGTWAIVGVMVPSRLVATMGSVLTFGGYLGGSAAPVITGVIVDRTHSFANGLLISACLAIAAAAVFAFGIRIKDQI